MFSLSYLLKEQRYGKFLEKKNFVLCGLKQGASEISILIFFPLPLPRFSQEFFNGLRLFVENQGVFKFQRHVRNCKSLNFYQQFVPGGIFFKQNFTS
jgi:hypothetical protein